MKGVVARIKEPGMEVLVGFFEFFFPGDSLEGTHVHPP
jgi:hypothetical protein